MDAPLHLVHRQELTDDARRCDEDILCAAAERIRCNLLHGGGIHLALCPRARVCTARIGDNGACRMRRNNRLGDVYGRSRNSVLRKCSRNGGLLFTVDHGNIEVAALLDARLDAGCLKSLRVGNPELCTLFAEHIFSSIFLQNYGYMGTRSSPARSSKPNAIFIFCTACPAAPLTRLSMAEKTMTRRVRGSICHARSQ